MIGISIEIIFQEDEPNENPCDNCKKEIEGKRYVMMLQIGEPMNAIPFDYQLCETCYLIFIN